jgi:Rab proteins geranylgeranyltransferase component A
MDVESEDAPDSELEGPPKKKRKAFLQQVPNGREDLIPDTSIEFRAKMALVKFLNSVAKPDEAPDVDDAESEEPLSGFLDRNFKIPESLHPAIHGISLSSDSIRATQTKYALPRIRRHLRSIGVFGPGFGSVIPKWGGTAEIAQVACRAGAVGGAVYVLGRGIKRVSAGEAETKKDNLEVELSDGEKVLTKWIVGSPEDGPQSAPRSDSMPRKEFTRSINIVSSALDGLFPTIAEGGPSPAGTVVVVPGDAQAIGPETDDIPPVYLFIHSADTGECPTGQSKLQPIIYIFL